MDLYYFMPLYRITYCCAWGMYVVYMGTINGKWFGGDAGQSIQFMFWMGIAAVLCVVYVHFQQQMQCLMSGLNEYQFALRNIAPHSSFYLARLVISLFVF